MQSMLDNLSLEEQRQLAISIMMKDDYFEKARHMINNTINNNVDIVDDVIVYGYAQMYREEVQFKCDRVKFVQDTNIQTLWINQVLINKKRSNNMR